MKSAGWRAGTFELRFQSRKINYYVITLDYYKWRMKLKAGGSGDLLAGYLVGLLAQPLLQENVVKTLSYGIWQHGAAADKLNDSKLNWTIEDLSQQIGGTKP